jgi:hypothetical protein
MLHEAFIVFPRWPNLFLVVAHFVNCNRLFIAFLDFSFLQLSATIIMLSVLLTEQILDLVSFILYIADIEFDGLYVLVGAVVILIVSLAVASYFCIRHQNAMIATLSYDEVCNVHDMDEPSDYTLTDPEKVDRF